MTSKAEAVVPNAPGSKDPPTIAARLTGVGIKLLALFIFL